MWQSKLKSITPVADVRTLPDYAFQFFFRNIGEFGASFTLLSGAAIASSVLRFVIVALLANLISNATTLSTDRVLFWYLPAFVAASTGKEAIDFLLRRYGESFPQVYSGHLWLRFYRTFFALRSHRLLNASKERLNTLLGKYVGHVTQFLSDWFWGTTRRLTQLVIVLGILFQQNPAILAFNLIYMAAFLALSFGISRRFSMITRVLSEHMIDAQSVSSRTFLQLNTVQRLGRASFFLNLLCGLTGTAWEKLDNAYRFHARRWLLQLVLFNLLYIGTLVSGVLQVIDGELPLGFLILIKYAFDNLWDILTYSIEYYVNLVTQKEDTAIIRRELGEIVGSPPAARGVCTLGDWREIRLQNAHAEFRKESDGTIVSIRVPELVIRRGEKIGIIGGSGAGKTTVLNMLLGLIPFSGELSVDGRSIKDMELSPDDVVLISTLDPFFNISLAQNLFLGRNPPQHEIARILRGLKVDGFASDLLPRVGDPGVHFSAGQEQRLRIARGVFQGAGLYLFDEPFLGIDEDTKAEVMAFLENFLRVKSVVLVTHNANELSLVDTVFEFKGGLLSKRSSAAVPQS